MKDIKIIVATHKKYKMPSDEMYLPVQLGSFRQNKLGYQPDNSGENISEKNPSFCELTGLYWAWRNMDNDYIGLVHYRRYFKGKTKSKDIFEKVLNQKEVAELLDNTDIILTKRRNYYIENIYNHYANTLHIEPLDRTREIISKNYPDYLNSFDKCMRNTHMHAFNMFIMKKEKLDEYCTWLFDILFTLEEQMTGIEYNAFHSRYPGRVSELLLDVWIEKNGYTYKEVPFIYMERIDNFNKVLSFLKAKFLKKKYGQSF